MSETPALDRFEGDGFRGGSMPTDNPTVTPATPQPLMNIAQVAERLAVTVRHVRRLVSDKRIPYIRWGYHLRFDPAEIEDWIDRSRHSC